MSKKLPKAIRPNLAQGGAFESDLRVSKPVPENTGYAKPESETVVSTNEVAAMAAGARKTRARKLVERFSLWSGVAGLLPLPVVDLVAVGGLQIQMLRRLSQIYGVPFSKNRGKAI